jgi:predicted HNH restriction endonuclease
MYKFLIFIGLIIYISIKYYSILVAIISFFIFNNVYILSILFFISILYKWLIKKNIYRSNFLDLIFTQNQNTNLNGNIPIMAVYQKRNVTPLTKKIIASNQKWICAMCNNTMDYTYEIDHIMPLFKGGTNDMSNLMALCRNCHGKKTILEKIVS